MHGFDIAVAVRGVGKILGCRRVRAGFDRVAQDIHAVARLRGGGGLVFIARADACLLYTSRSCNIWTDKIADCRSGSRNYSRQAPNECVSFPSS